MAQLRALQLVACYAQVFDVLMEQRMGIKDFELTGCVEAQDMESYRCDNRYRWPLSAHSGQQEP